MSDLAERDDILADTWTRLVRAQHDRMSDWRWFTFATSGLDGAPRARTVVLRDVAPTKRCLAFHTDRRSAKFGEIANNPGVALHFLDRRAAIQVRMTGRAAVAAEEHTSQVWGKLNELARSNYRGPAATGARIADGSALPIEADASQYDATNFAVVQVLVFAIDWLELKSSQHRRASYQFENDRWVSQWISP